MQVPPLHSQILRCHTKNECVKRLIWEDVSMLCTLILRRKLRNYIEICSGYQ